MRTPKSRRKPALASLGSAYASAASHRNLTRTCTEQVWLGFCGSAQQSAGQLAISSS